MTAVVHALSNAVRRAPVLVLLAAVLSTIVVGAIGLPRIVQGGGNEGFSPDNPELVAQQDIGEVFSSSGGTVMQVLIQADEGGDVISAAGVQASLALQQAVVQGHPELVGDPAVTQSVITPMLPVLQALQGQDPATLTDAQVDAAFAQMLTSMPPEQSGQLVRLLPDGTDPAQAASDLALGVVILDRGALPDDDIEAAEVVNEVAADIEAIEVPGVTLQPFAFELLFANQDDFAEEIGRLFGTAILIILVILGLVYFSRPREDGSWLGAVRRTAADVAATIAVIMMAIIWVQGMAGILGPDGLGLMSALAEPAQLMPVLLVGLGVDYGIHMTARYRAQVGEHGESVAEAIGTATRTVGVALVLATVTTAVGFLTNITAPVPALKDFGILAAIGILAAFVLMLTAFPALRLLLDRRAEAAGRLPRQTLGANSEGLLPKLMSGVAVFAERFAVATLIVTVGIGGVLGAIGLANVSTEFSFTDFLPDDAPLITTLDTLEAEFGGGVGEQTNVLVRGPITAEVHNAMVAANAELTGVDGVEVFGDQPQAQSPVAVLGQLLLAAQPGAGQPGADGAPEGQPSADPTALPPVDPALVGQIVPLLDPGALTVPADTDVTALYDLLLQASPALAGQVIAPEGAAVQFIISTSAGEQGAAALADDLDEVFAPVEAVLDAGDDAVVVTSQDIVTDRIISGLRDSQLQSLFIAVLAAMLLLVVNFWVTERRPMLGVITIAPVALVVLWVFGMMAATGIPVGPVTATIAALAVGIGVPYTIHVSHRFSEDREVFDSPEDAIRSTVRHTGGALAGSALTTIAGFGILTTSTLTPFQQFGLVTAYAIGFALVAATVVLPAMLVLYDRWRRAREGSADGRQAEAHDAMAPLVSGGPQ